MALVRSKSIRSRLFKILILAICGVVAVIVAVWRISIEPSLRMGVAKEQQQLARRVADQIDEFLDQRIGELVMAVEIGRFWENERNRQKEALYRLLKLDPLVHEVSVSDREGQEVLRLSRTRVYSDAEFISLKREEKFQQAIQGQIYMGKVYHAPTKEPFVTLAVPIKFTPTDIRGVVVAEVSLKALWDSISHIKVGKSGRAFVVDRQGRLIAHPDYSKVLLGMSMAHLPEVKEFLSHPDKDPDFGEVAIGQDGKKVISTFAVARRRPWGVFVEEPVVTALAEVKQVERFASLIALFLLAGAFGLSYWFSERITRPVRQLEGGSKLIADGNLEHKLAIHTGDEIETLAHQFNQMADALKASQEGLEAKIAERTKEISALYTALTPLAPADSVEQMIERIIERLMVATGADAALIRVRDKATGAFVCTSQRGFPAYYLERALTLPPGAAGSALDYVFKRGEPVISANIAVDPQLKGKIQLEVGFQSCAYLPLKVGMEVRGIVHLASRERGHFSEEKKDHLMAIARQMGVAIENRELFEESQRRAQEQAALSTIATATSQSLQIDELLEIALDRVLKVTGRERVSIRLKGPVTGKVTLAAHRGFSPEEVEDLLRRVPHQISEQVFASGQALVVNDRAELDRPQSLLPQSRSVAWIPIKAGAKVVGVLGISATRPVPFVQREVEFLQAIGNVIGVAIENARLFGETQRSLERIRALNEIDQAITSTLNLHTVLDLLLDKIQLFLPHSAACTVRLVNKESGLMEPVVCRNLDEEEWKAAIWKGGRGPSNRVFGTKVPVVIRNVQTDPHTTDVEFFRKHNLVSFMGVPLIAKGEVLGMLSFYTKEEHEFSSEETELFLTLASQAAVAIHNARLYEETQRNLERIQALREIDQATASTLDLPKVLDVLLEKIDLVLPYAAATVRLFNKQSGLLEPVACRNLDEKEWKAERWRGGRGIPNAVFENKAPVMIRNVQTDPAVKDVEFFCRHGLVSYLGVPLIVKEEILGVLSFYTKKEHQFSDEEVDFLTTLAGQAAIAIHNSQLYEEIKSQAVELEKSNQVKDEFLSVMSHELRTPLNVVMGYAGMIKDRMLGEINPDQERALAKVVSRSKELLTMISGILEVTSIETEAVKVERDEVNLARFLDGLKTACPTPPDRKLTLNWDYPADLPVVNTDSEKLKHILQNLINNAMKFTPEGSVTISGRVREDGRQQATVSGEAPGARIPGSRLLPQPPARFVEFKVADTGIGIAREFFPVIFEKFRQIDSSETRPYGGVGIGLYIVKKLTELLGGRVDVESQPHKGSTFTVTLPCER